MPGGHFRDNHLSLTSGAPCDALLQARSEVLAARLTKHHTAITNLLAAIILGSELYPKKLLIFR